MSVRAVKEKSLAMYFHCELTFLADGRIRVSLRSYLNHSRPRHDTRTGRRRRNAAGAEAAPHLLGACCLDCEPFCVPRHWVVDFLSLAQPAKVDVFPFRICAHLAHDLVSRFDASFSKGRQHRRISRLQKALLYKTSGFLHAFKH